MQFFKLPALCLIFLCSQQGSANYSIQYEISYVTNQFPGHTCTDCVSEPYSEESFKKSLLAALQFKNSSSFFKLDPERFEERQYAKKYFKKIQSYQFLSRQFTSSKQLLILKQQFPHLLDSDDQWATAADIINKIYRPSAHETEVSKLDEKSIDEWLHRRDFYPDLTKAVRTIEQIANDGDTLVAVGNTPQLICTALEFSKKKLNIIPVALSSWPGKEKIHTREPILHNWVTQTALDNFRNYLVRIGIAPGKIQTGKIYILDYIGNGSGGIEFLIQQIHHLYQSENKPNVNVLSIGDNARRNFRSVDIDNFPLNLTVLAQTLDAFGNSTDQFQNPLRILPSFPAWKWHFWEEDPVKFQSGWLALRIIEKIRLYFK